MAGLMRVIDMRYIDRDKDNNIVSINARKQRDDQEEISIETMIEQLNSQDLQWDHGY